MPVSLSVVLEKRLTATANSGTVLSSMRIVQAQLRRRAICTVRRAVNTTPLSTMCDPSMVANPVSAAVKLKYTQKALGR
jgi:hypothetical protein